MNFLILSSLITDPFGTTHLWLNSFVNFELNFNEKLDVLFLVVITSWFSLFKPKNIK